MKQEVNKVKYYRLKAKFESLRILLTVNASIFQKSNEKKKIKIGLKENSFKFYNLDF
jgi:hypothetical protein